MSETTESLAEMLNRIKPVRRRESTQICLRPDLLDAWDEAEEKLAAATEAKSSDRLGAGISKEARALAAEVSRIEDEIEATQARFVFEGIDADEWNSIAANHPPREGNQIDAFYGSNRDAVLDEAIRLCMVEPVIDSDDAWAALRKACNTSEWTELRNTVNRANGGVNESPKSERASRILSSSASASKPRGRGASVPASSTAG